MRRFVFLAALFLTAPLLAAEIRQIVPPAGQSQAVLQAPSARGTWRIVADDSLAEVQPQLVADASLAIVQGTPGRYLVRWRQGPLARWIAITVDLGGVGPSPRPDDPPTPTPDPPVPIPTPLPAAGLYVLIVHDPLQQIPQDQQDAMDAEDVRKFLRENCAKDTSGAPAFRFVSPKSNLAKEPQIWRDALKVEHPGIEPPYWIVSNGRTKLVEPFPADKDAVLAALKKLLAEGKP
jgi:hypothetical protein